MDPIFYFLYVPGTQPLFQEVSFGHFDFDVCHPKPVQHAVKPGQMGFLV